MMAIADEPIANLVIRSNDGTKVAYALSEKPKITFTETDLILTTNSVAVNYQLDNIACLTYEKSSESGITDLKNDEIIFELKEDALLFPYLKANSIISIYSANGNLVFKRIVRLDGEYAFPISNLNAGFYLVKVSGLSYKIVKR